MTISEFLQDNLWPLGLYATNMVLVVLVVLHMLYQRRSPQNLMAWLFALILLPLIGVLVYWVFGSRKLLYKKNKSNLAFTPSGKGTLPGSGSVMATALKRLLEHHQLPTTTVANCVHAYSAETLWPAFEQRLKQARHSICLQTYIFELDDTGQRLADLLAEKARAGLEVKLLLDSVGSFALYRRRKRLRFLEQAGVKVAFFQPLFKTFFNQQVNLRNHRKIYLIDQTTVFTGGMNLSDDYFGPDRTDAQDGGKVRWVDWLFEINGPSVVTYAQVFAEDWFYTTGEIVLPLTEDEKKQNGLASGQQTAKESDFDQAWLQVLPSGPDMAGDVLFESLLYAIYQAKERIQIVSPYFIPDSSIMSALLIAIKRGVTVTLLTPAKSDHLIFDLGRSSYMRELAEAGGEVLLYPSGMLHAKLVVFDQQAVLLGTANLDYRSLFINYEMAAFAYSEGLLAELGPFLQTLRLKSDRFVPKTSKGRRLFENLTRIFAPIL
ncbi:MAG: cardiolipin synthase [Hydrogenovibrio sp.]|uniref:cardiolipin synthase n=1 Tax=Hydrogenovibrio sp. TaxID=2065821 RepID=UPI002870A2A1|nr:cardiolipin synthase [Hydrogenovibrio sp.]MDR9499419.1 cardiolipin synthase [Hydrogenovibrio sp.]